MGSTSYATVCRATTLIAAAMGLPLALLAAPPSRPAPLDCTGDRGVSLAEVKTVQAAWAKYLGRPVEETVEVSDGVTMTFVLVPPGTFRTGSPPDEGEHEKDESLHEVTLTEPFDLGKTEVTQAQYQALTGQSPSYFEGADLPVELVTWEEAHDYAAKLTKKQSDNHVYRLPTEAEWEYACRGGRPSSRPFGVGDGRALSSREANFNGDYPYGGADKGPYLHATCRVGSYPANALGLFDMHGNVDEWCADWYGPYPEGDVTNPTGPSEGLGRVVRGGSWISHAGSCRAAVRGRFGPRLRFYDLGFRLARSVPPGGK
jgi:formylglycine-generating enzyme required for sulfatase activity